MVKTKDKSAFKRDFNFLVDTARKIFTENQKLSDRYAYIAYRIFLSKKLKLSKNEKVLICKRCNKILIPGKTVIVRLKNGIITYKCLNCGNVRKLGYDKGNRR
jgi:ribonuclease P protein subunit RPR2